MVICKECEAKLYRTRKRSARLSEHIPANPRANHNQTVPEPHPLLFQISTSLKVKFSIELQIALKMKNRTDTLEIGSRAPDFSLAAANRNEGDRFTLGLLLAEGVLVLEFVRGTW